MDGETSGDWEAERLQLLLEVEQLRAEKAVFEQALLDTREELLEARAVLAAEESDELAGFNDGLLSDVRRGY